MAITLAQSKVGMADKVDIAIIDSFGRKSFLLNALVFDNAVSPGTGGSTLTYGYLQLKTPSSAAVRAVNSEYTAGEAIKEKKSADCAIMGGSYEIDRVLIGTAGALNELGFQIDQKTTATVNLFHYLVINGVAASHKFDGLNVLLADTENEFSSGLDISTSAKAKSAGNELVDQLDALCHAVDGGADMLLMNEAMLLKVRSCARAAGYYSRSEDAFGRPVELFGNIPMLDLGKYYNGSATVDVVPTRSADEYREHAVTADTFTTDGTLYTKSGSTYTAVSSGSYSSSTTYYIKVAAAKTTDIYAVRVGLDGFCGFSPVGDKLVKSYTPDLTAPGAVKKGEIEIVAGVALKNTKAAAVLRGIQIKA